MAKEYTSMEQVYRDADQIQNASNLSGVLHAWAAMSRLVREDAERMGTRYERHPVNVLLVSKVVSLMQVNVDSIGCVSNIENVDLFHEAYKAMGEVLPHDG
jgi:hypothetical protein